MNAAGRVNRPTSTSTPVTSSISACDPKEASDLLETWLAARWKAQQLDRCMFDEQQRDDDPQDCEQLRLPAR